jgi:hypothetical protein
VGPLQPINHPLIPIRRGARQTLKERDAIAFDSEEAIKKRAAAAEERRKQSRNMVGETVKRGLEESKGSTEHVKVFETILMFIFVQRKLKKWERRSMTRTGLIPKLNSMHGDYVN